MAALRQKADMGTAMMILFAATLITGFTLHLKKHGILIEPRYLIKIIHWLCGFAMCLIAFVHWRQFGKALTAIRHKVKWFYVSTSLLKVVLVLTLLTGSVKLLSPVKIPNLGLWHYAFGIATGVTTIIHLVRGIPTWRRIKRIKN